MIKGILALTIALLAALSLGNAKTAAAISAYSQIQSPIIFEAASVDNAYPESLTFNIVASSVEGEIVSATLLFATRDETSTRRQIVEIDPSDRVELSYTWDTSNITIPPSSPIVYHWEVVDSSGNRISTPEELIFYDDIRYEWSILEDENIAVWWHDRPISFGGKVFEIAQEAFTRQQLMFRAEPEYQIKIIVYNDYEEFAEWHSYISEFVGGQAFPSIGVTTQIVSAYNSVETWLTDVIPHEISHLYFYQATDHPFVDPPAWLNEGLAQLNEFSLNTAALDYAERVIRRGDLFPLWALSGSFGRDEDDVRLAYAESLSAALFLKEQYGSDGISKLLAAYKSGLSDDEALKKGLGLTINELQREWLAWMGVDPDMYPTPTATAALIWPTAPSYTYPTKNPPTTTPEAENTPVRQASTTPSPTMEATEIPVIVEVATQIPSIPAQTTQTAGDDLQNEDSEEDGGGFGFCGSIAFPIMLAAFFSIRALVPAHRGNYDLAGRDPIGGKPNSSPED